MLIFLDARLAFLATPKTGTTAIEMALRRRADIAFLRGRKHMPVRRFLNHVAPFLENTFDCQPETVALMRAPLDQLRSWYRYRALDDKIGTPRSTRGVSFDQFLTDLLADDPPDYARINGQYDFLCSNGKLAVDHLFAYENMPAFVAFMQDRLGFEFELKRKNVSPDIDADLSPQIAARFREARAAEFHLHARLTDAGGYLRNL